MLHTPICLICFYLPCTFLRLVIAFKNYNLFTDIRYTDDHGWVRCTGNTATVGITKHAADLYGDIMYLKLPNLGETFKKGGRYSNFLVYPLDTIGNAESTKAASDICAPISGKVESVNLSLYENLQVLNKTPESDGNLIIILLGRSFFRVACENEDVLSQGTWRVNVRRGV